MIRRTGRAVREALRAYVNRVEELAEDVCRNERFTKRSLLEPSFTIQCSNLTDWWECIPEYKVDFGPKRSIKPIARTFHQNRRTICFVEVKKVGRACRVMRGDPLDRRSDSGHFREYFPK